MDMNLSKLWEFVVDRETWHTVVHGVAESDKTEQLNWTELTIRHYELIILGALLVAMLQRQYN